MRVSIASRVAAGLLPLFLLGGLVQAALLGALRPRALLLLAGPLLGLSLLTGRVFSWMAQRRIRPFVASMRRLAAGDFSATLPADSAPASDLVIMRDTFEAMKVALQRALGGLREADRQRRQLFADLAHELATPTSSILGLADALGSPRLCPDEAARARCLEGLAQEARRLARLIEDVGELAQLEDPAVTLSRAPCDVAQVAARVAAPGPAGGGGAALRCELRPAWALADAHRLEQVVVNLLENARRHAPPEGEIRLRVAVAEGEVRLEVEDSGPGVPEELLPRLGQRLFRADPSRDRRTGGHGLGLSIVREIVHRHGGRLSFARGALGGLLVTVTLPALPAA